MGANSNRVICPFIKAGMYSINRLVFIFFVLLSPNIQAITFSVTSSLSFDLTDKVPTEAGTYFNKVYKTDDNATLISIADIKSTQRWAVFVRQSNRLDGLNLKIKRTGQGSGDHSVKYGSSYLSFPTDDWSCFFTGQGQHQNIPIKTRLGGIGVADSYGEFNTDLIYKVETFNGQNPCE